MLENNSSVQFSENFQLVSNLKYSIYDEFDELVIPSKDSYPARVRSDNKLYLNNFSKSVVIGRLQLDYFKSIGKNYFLISAGIFEEMFSGLGFEYLYDMRRYNLYVGAELFGVRKRL